MDLQQMAQQVAGKTALPTAPEDIKKVLSAILTNPDFWQIAGLADRPFHMVVECIKVGEERGLLSVQGPSVYLTEEGRKRCQAEGITPRLLSRCPACQGRGIDLGSWGDLLSRFQAMVEDRPLPLKEYDQAYITPECTLARIAYMADRGDLLGKDVILLGDDDLVGLGIALSGLARRVVVVEIDERLNRFVGEKAISDGLSIEIAAHDLRDPLPPSLTRCFHTFLTDPPDTLAGMETFVARGLEALRGGGGAGYFGMTMVESSLRTWRELQRRLVQKYDLVITDLVYDFNLYRNWNYLLGSIRSDLEPLTASPQEPWYYSSLYRVETLSSEEIEMNETEGLYVTPESLVWGMQKGSVPGAQ